MFIEFRHVLFGIFLCCPMFCNLNVIFFQHPILCKPLSHYSIGNLAYGLGTPRNLYAIYKNVRIVLLFSQLFVVIKIGGHICGYNQFWYSFFSYYILMVFFLNNLFLDLFTLKSHIFLFSRSIN
jgi:hypothetical protein